MSGHCYSLQPYLAAGILQHGAQRLSVEVVGQEYVADLGRNGEIFFEGLAFTSPSSFSLFVKRKIYPSRKTDDGWANVKYEGQFLASYREKLESSFKRTPLRPEKNNFGENLRQNPAFQGAVEAAANLNGTGGGSRTEAANNQTGIPERSGSNRNSVDASNPPNNITDFNDNMDNGTLGGGKINSGEGGVVHQEQGNMVIGTAGELCAGEDKGNDHMEVVVDPVGEPAGGGLNPPFKGVDETWVLCDKCQKWRRVKTEFVTEGLWFCYQNPDKRFASCEVPQELSDSAIDRLLEEEHFHTYVHSSTRPPLAQATAIEFEEDLISFLRQLGEESKAEQLRCKRIQCNNRPLDIFGLYREVVKQGGLIANEAYDETGRWVGGINFAGHIFPRMKNFTKDHRATSVGNQLLSNYRKFLYDYERAWRHIDLASYQGKSAKPPKRKQRQSKGTANGTATLNVNMDMEVGVGLEAEAFLHSAFEGGSAGVVDLNHPIDPKVDPSPRVGSAIPSDELSDERKQNSHSGGSSFSGSSNKRCDALLMLAGIITDREQQNATDPLTRQLEPAGPSRPNRGPWRTKRRKVAHTIDQEALAGAVNTVQNESKWGPGEGPKPGDLLLARDPMSPGRIWPVLVASVEDLPEAIAEGDSNDSAKSTGFPFTCKDLSSCAGVSLPVLVFSTNFLGWVPQALCEPYNSDLAMSTYISMLRTPSESHTARSEHQILLRRILKAALQYSGTPSAAAAKQMTQGISMQYISDRLLDLELDLPAHVLGNECFATWAEWRRRVSRADSASSLASECLMFSYQLDQDVIKRGSGSTLWSSLDSLLGTGKSSGEPTVMSVDRAVTLLTQSIDWIRANKGCTNPQVEVQNKRKMLGEKRKAFDGEDPEAGCDDAKI